MVAFIGGVLLKQNNERLSFLQRLFSLLHYSSHCSKQVHVCMTINYIDGICSFTEDCIRLVWLCPIRVQSDILMIWFLIMMNRLSNGGDKLMLFGR